MKVSTVSEERFLIDRGTDAKRASRTSWGEQSYVKIGSTLSNNAFSLLDYRAPAGFGVVRHPHHREEGMARFFCSMAFANATGITALHICGRPTYKTRLSTKGWL
jgi:hypothetical protein